MKTDDIMYQAYDDALEALKKDKAALADNFQAWSDYIEVLRAGFASAEKLGLENPFPSIVFDNKGLEWQIDVEPSDDRVLFDDSGERTIADMVFRELQVARAKQEWSQDDSFEEFSDLDDDEDELDRTAFEKAWLSMEKDRQREFYEEFIKGQVPPKRKTESASEAPAGEAQSQDSATSETPTSPSTP